MRTSAADFLKEPLPLGRASVARGVGGGGQGRVAPREVSGLPWQGPCLKELAIAGTARRRHEQVDAAQREVGHGRRQLR